MKLLCFSACVMLIGMSLFHIPGITNGSNWSILEFGLTLFGAGVAFGGLCIFWMTEEKFEGFQWQEDQVIFPKNNSRRKK